jgi:hypothetical protein
MAMTAWPKQDYASMVKFFGPVGENQTQIAVPDGYPMKLAYEPFTPIRRITCHEKVAKSFESILKQTLAFYGPGIKGTGLDLFGGCLNVRKKRGGTTWSIHAWGCAFDLDPDHNGLKTPWAKARFSGKLYVPFWEIVEGEGCVSLGRSWGKDAMHGQWARL